MTLSGAMRSPHKTVRVVLALVVCSTIFADYWEYSRTYHSNPDTWIDVIRGTAAAPQQYRIGVPLVADWLRRHGHMGLRHGFALIDLFSAVVAVYLLYSVFERSRAYRAADEVTRWFGAAAFLFLVQFYFAWITWYQRPETMASAATLVITLWLLTVRLPLPRRLSPAVTSATMVLISAIQGFIRADVIFVLHVGLLFVCLTRFGEGFSLRRGVQGLTSLACLLAAGGIQYWLMHGVYPHASYRDTRVFELTRNLTSPGQMIPFVLFMLPWIWLMQIVLRRRAEVNGPSAAVVSASVVYLTMWIIVGRIEEVRIFLPYAVALIPLTCRCLMRTAYETQFASKI